MGVTFTPAEVRSLVRSGGILAQAGRYRKAIVETADLRLPRAPFLTTSAARALAPRCVVVRDGRGEERPVGVAAHLRAAARFFADGLTVPLLACRERGALAAFEAAPRYCCSVRTGRPVYARTDLNVSLLAGGSVAHTAGVVNGFADMGLRPLMVTPERVPTVAPSVDMLIVPRVARFLDFPRSAVTAYSRTFERALGEVLRNGPPSWVYHRYSLGSFSASRAAARAGVPLVLEYNGSEVWATTHWGSGRPKDDLDARIEVAVLRAADLIVVVSEVLRTQLVATGIAPQRILVNPNGVDTDRFGPNTEGSEIRRRLGIDARVVVGFVGTFGRWHGAEVLADAFADLCRDRPEEMAAVHLLLIGDGPTVPRVRNATAHLRNVTMTGMVPQNAAPDYLAACDVLVAPHIPNADGSPFFGSPTKLFEYMATGRGIVASKLGQIGDVLDDGLTGLLVTPGDREELAAAIRRLVLDRELRDRLGAAAREAAVQHHTWGAHAVRIVQAVEAMCG